MGESNQEQKVAIIPKGTRISIMGCSIELLEDTKVEGDQNSINIVLKSQEDHKNGIDIDAVCNLLENPTLFTSDSTDMS